MNRHIIVLIAAALWYIACRIIGSRCREITRDGHNYPTRWSTLFRWIAPLGAVLIMGIDLALSGGSGRR